MLTYNNRYLCILSLCFNLLILHVIMDLLLFIYNNGYIQIVTWFVSVYVFKCVERECLLGVVHNCWVGDCKCYRLLLFLGYILNYVVHEFVIFILICLKLLLSYMQLWIGIVCCLLEFEFKAGGENHNQTLNFNHRSFCNLVCLVQLILEK